MITEIYEFWFFDPKMAVSWRTSAFQKKRPWNPHFYSVFWVRAFWANVSKKRNFEKPARKMEKFDNWKANFGVFLLFFFLASFFSCFLCFFVCLFCFLFLLFVVCFLVVYIQKTLFPLEKGIFCLFAVFPFLSPLAFFGLPLFVFLFLCLSLFFFSFFLPSCLSFLLSFGSLFLSLSLFFFLLCFSFMKGTTSKY